MLFAICEEGYLSAILVYRPRDNKSAKEFCLVEIQCACTSILCSAHSIAILCSGCIASPLVEFFYSPCVMAKLSQKICKWESLKVSIDLANA